MSNVWLQYVKDYWQNSFRDKEFSQIEHFSSKYLELKKSNERELKVYFETFFYQFSSPRLSPIFPPYLIAEFIFFIPGIILIPLIRTVYDYFIRPHYQKEQIKALKSTIASKAQTSEEFLKILKPILENCYTYTSYNSRALSSNLMFIMYKHLFELHLSTLDEMKEQGLTSASTEDSIIGLLYKCKLIEDSFYIDLIKLTSESLIWRVINSSHWFASVLLNPINAEEIDQVFIAKHAETIKQIKIEQLAAIEEYLDAPENNGTKLMQSLFSFA